MRAAILGSDRRLAESLLGATHNICCAINVPEEQEDEEEEPEDETDDEEEEEDDR